MSEEVRDLEQEQQEMQELVGMPDDRLDMPSGDIVKKWHDKYPNTEIRGFPFPNLYVVYRAYNMLEQEELAKERTMIEMREQREITELENTRLILNKCVLWPTNFIERFDKGDLPGGIPRVLTSYIMMISGFVDLIPEVL